MPLPQPKFEDGEVWDGTTVHSRPSVDVYKGPDAEIGNRHSSEIIALEELLNNVIDVIELLENPGAANSVLAVKDDQSGLEYKVLTEGPGIGILHSAGVVTIEATPPEDTAFGYTSGKLTSVTSASGTKTLAYSGGKLDTISNTETQTLSTFGYTSGKLTSITVTPL